MDFDLLPWHEQAQIRMIAKHMKVKDLAEKAGISREYTSALIHGRAFSKPAVAKISNILGIEACTSIGT